MWIIAKIKYKEISSFKTNLGKIIKEDLEFMNHISYIQKNILKK